MNDLLENVLRDTLSRRAAHVDPQARRRLLAIDYRPRRRRIPILPAVGAVGLAGAAVALALIFTLGSTPAPAFAGWSPTPTQPRPGQISTALTACATPSQSTRRRERTWSSRPWPMALGRG